MPFRSPFSSPQMRMKYMPWPIFPPGPNHTFTYRPTESICISLPNRVAPGGFSTPAPRSLRARMYFVEPSSRMLTVMFPMDARGSSSTLLT